MYSINNNLKEKILELNSILSEKYGKVLSLDETFIRDFIEENVGYIQKVDKLSREELMYYYQKGGILGVDGSRNRIGGAYPHFVEIYQGLAKSTLYKDRPIYKADFYTPLYDERIENLMEDSREQEESIRNRKLSTIEIEAALEGIRQLNPYAVMMDGSLIRYDIESFSHWIELRKECERRGIILVGVIKDIKTSIIGDLLKEDEDLNIDECFYDRELLYGILEYGEMITIHGEVTKKTKEGFSSLFMRSSKAPTVIGMDILDSQKKHLEEMARLVLTLTPEDSRGVPLWIDIVDSEVKITDDMVRGLMESYLDRQILEMLFISERDKRTL
ncbi:NurA domain-containing protein [Keratinibaculum paraultunense]|uniref:NurA domain-containing protein n=1 Tax=Keratinibaculum paraultunense TaxID=1278232 RepID=A0A4R3KXS0_9FIRM|nr:DNA double-strand break repair nuclease NurA [Keratinibaculum paraultunense]QQY79876.1 DNA double-strand break repair nuclease NurA [Keratinibaculum paraultunense]TCS88762.1 NurA domain-containing protein [Keratinibaculum paraultunense]